MTAQKFLGEFEIVVLSTLIRLGDEAYGARAIAEIEARTTRKVAIGALYATLSRLESKGYVQSALGEATAERGGRAKRYYRVTGEGAHALEASAAMLQRAWSGVIPALKEA